MNSVVPFVVGAIAAYAVLWHTLLGNINTWPRAWLALACVPSSGAITWAAMHILN